jgi:nicotinamidase/pyrazinamidase
MNLSRQNIGLYTDHYKLSMAQGYYFEGQEDDGYSALEATNVDLKYHLDKHGVNRLFLAGLTTEYCVKATAQDAIRNNYHTFIVNDAVASVEANPGDGEKAIKEMESAGVNITDSQLFKLM